MPSFTRTLGSILMMAALVGLPACDSGPAKPDAKATAKAATKTDVKAPVEPAPAKPVVTPPTPAVQTPPAADSPEGKVQLAAVVAREISGDPDRADEILGKHGLDRDKLDALMFEIADDPQLTEKYMAARRSS